MAKQRWTEDEFRSLARKVSNWGRWGPDDQAGTLNFLTNETRLAAASQVIDGLPISCSQDINGALLNNDQRTSLQVPFWLREESYGVALELMLLEPHGWTMTHLDALSHINFDGLMYNNRQVDTTISADHSVNSILSAKDGIVGRGVLLDLPPVLGKQWMEPTEIANRSVLESALKRQNVTLQPGDILLIRTGRAGRDAALGMPPISEGLAGVSIDCAEWFHDAEVASLLCDAGMDPQPSEVENIRIPWHILTLVMMGMMITHNANLEELARQCADRKRWTFMFVQGPLRVQNANSSPVNPIAIL